MKTKLLTLAFGLVLAQNAFATGGFNCSGETNSGKKVEVLGCVPHSIPSLCSDVTVAVNDAVLFTVPRDNVPAFYLSGNFIGLQAMDENYNESLVRLEYFGAKNKKNLLVVKAPNGQTFKFKDVTCLVE
jgi:hypothetical protein